MINQQKIQFAQAKDGTNIAYSANGEGPVMVKAANWLSHMEYDWECPVWQHWLNDLSKNNTLVRYDERGCGLSDRDVKDLSFESWVDDLETVVDTMGLKRFPLLGVSQGGAVAIAYAVRHPERVSHLILYGAYAQGRLVRDSSAASLEEAATMSNLIKLGWGREHDAFRQVFSSQFMPGGDLEQLQSFNELQRISCSPEAAVRFLDEFNQIDVLDLASQVKCPTLVMHARGDLRVPFDAGRQIASLIPRAQFVPLESDNHILLDELAWSSFMSQLNGFFSEYPDQNSQLVQISDLTPRELQVLDKIAAGLDNSEIATQLGLQDKTVRNHITHIFDKLAVSSRAQAIVMAREAGLGKH
ncbi:alpha/beta fold hydrolase [Marinicella sp. S1101]|uniref:alpha/beta fold hydrolase n=1 Tax=Marinicella marina TaxID=2996016 RepID=UPI002260AA03|nr:alpha/beta fold hydrolase [Marinicella marina]MCX7554867.1 alpha/beta fold hydrolase [Marinicella marina]MDJ1141525.1 alpha/beta fold hydrolase [Marinicella marina]